MWETLGQLPFAFYLSLILMIAVLMVALTRLSSGAGLPMIAVVMTVFFWYVGDIFYNDYRYFLRTFSSGHISHAWYQIALFLVCFLLLSLILQPSLQKRSGVYELYSHGAFREKEYQRVFSACFYTCLAIWLATLLFVLIQQPSRVMQFVFPFLGVRYDPFARSQIGGGFSALFSLGKYLYLLTGATMGTVLALSTNKTQRRWAAFFCLSIWSLFILDRTRNSVIVVLLPFVLCWIFLRFRTTNFVRFLFLVFFLAVINFWFSFVMDVRGQQGRVAEAFYQSGISAVVESESRHAGLNMFEELCWVTRFQDSGKLPANGGQRYFAEIANIIPRGLWPSKPKIGVDYALARGQFLKDDGSVSATISTGIIGQGTLNFGPTFGPIFVALLMALWVRLLATIDTSRSRIKLPLVFLGLVLTFNLGRDITLLVLYPFLFGYLVFYYLELREKRRKRLSTSKFKSSHA